MTKQIKITTDTGETHYFDSATVEYVKEKKGRWKPEDAERYYYDNGRHCKSYGDTLDRERWAIGDCHKTKEESELWHKKQVTRQCCLDIAAEGEFGRYFYTVYMSGDGRVRKDWYDGASDRPIRAIAFPTEKLLQKAIDELGDDLKLLLEGV